MNSGRKHRLIFYTITLLSFAIRMLYYLFDFDGIIDSYGLFDSALNRIDSRDYVLSSGLGFAYTNACAKVLSRFGLNIDVVFIWQVFLEVIAISLFFWGAIYIWGTVSATVMTLIFMLSPVFLDSCLVVSPEEYFLFYFSILFYILAHFYTYTRRHSWFRSSIGEILILIMGFFAGMLITWSYLGFFAFIIMIYVVLNNYRINDDKSNILVMSTEDLDEKDQVMGGTTQIFMLFLGALIGMFFTLLKYTGYTGYTIVEQFNWWRKQFLALPGRAMDTNTVFAVNLLFCLSAAIITNAIMVVVNEKKELKRQAELEEIRQAELKTEGGAFVDRDNTSSDEYFVTKDGRTVQYLKEPLPGPKKHVHKELKFDIEEIGKENESVRITTQAVYEDMSADMLKAAEGIENVVRLNPQEKETRLEKIVILSNPDKSYEGFNDVKVSADEFDLFDDNAGDFEDFEINDVARLEHDESEFDFGINADDDFDFE